LDSDYKRVEYMLPYFGDRNTSTNSGLIMVDLEKLATGYKEPQFGTQISNICTKQVERLGVLQTAKDG